MHAVPATTAGGHGGARAAAPRERTDQGGSYNLGTPGEVAKDQPGGEGCRQLESEQGVHGGGEAGPAAGRNVNGPPRTCADGP